MAATARAAVHIVVTGSSGQIGSYAVDLAAQAGHPTTGIDKRPGPRTDHVLDVRTVGALETVLGEDAGIVHCAAQVSVQASLDDPVGDVDDNVGGTVAVLEAARRRDAASVVLVSSAAVYGHPIEVPVGEDHPLRPLSPYGAAKASAEIYGRMWAGLYGLPVVIVRPFNVYSVRQDPQNPYTGVMSKFADRVRAGQGPRVTGDGTQTRDFVHAADVADWLVRCATREVPWEGPTTTMNIGHGQETSIRDLAALFLSAAGSDLRPERLPRPTGEIDRSVADIREASRLGWAPRIRLDEGVRLLFEGREHPLAKETRRVG